MCGPYGRKVWRRVVKLIENNSVAPSRLFAHLIKSCRTSYRIIRQPTFTDADWTALGKCKHHELRELAQCRLAPGTNTDIAKLEFETSGCQWHGGEIRPQPDVPTCSAYDHSAQVAFEFLITELTLEEGGTAHSSWVVWQQSQCLG